MCTYHNIHGISCNINWSSKVYYRIKNAKYINIGSDRKLHRLDQYHNTIKILQISPPDSVIIIKIPIV